MDIYDQAAAIGRSAAEAVIELYKFANNQEDVDAISDGFWDELVSGLNKLGVEEISQEICECK